MTTVRSEKVNKRLYLEGGSVLSKDSGDIPPFFGVFMLNFSAFFVFSMR